MIQALTPRDKLLQLIASQSFQLGEFKLSSGGTSDYYIDCRTTTLHAEGARLTGRVITDLMQEKGWKPRAIGGMTMGADPIVSAVSILSAQQIQTRAPARTKPIDGEEFYVHGFLVRKQDKQHGTGKRIEGFQKKMSKVVIVDDVCTTGASTIQAIEAAREFGFDVIGVVCLVEREEAGGRAAVEKAANPAKFASVFTAADVRQEHLRQKEEQA
ncbi:MAG TPA: orotate phosphoribosyltransferase [Terriglobales bacterium]|nr:orotate phosphoribosyltransferase [Terriglobales bacterium]